jgi:hypothetical protein
MSAVSLSPRFVGWMLQMNGKLATSIVLLCEWDNTDAGHVKLLSSFCAVLLHCAVFWLRPDFLASECEYSVLRLALHGFRISSVKKYCPSTSITSYFYMLLMKVYQAPRYNFLDCSHRLDGKGPRTYNGIITRFISMYHSLIFLFPHSFIRSFFIVFKTTICQLYRLCGFQYLMIMNGWEKYESKPSILFYIRSKNLSGAAKKTRRTSGMIDILTVHPHCRQHSYAVFDHVLNMKKYFVYLLIFMK